MDIKGFAASLGLGMVTGAAVMLLIPRHSQAYRMADHAAHTLKYEAGKVLDSMT